MNNAFTFKINIVDDATGVLKQVKAQVSNVDDVVEQLGKSVNRTTGLFDKMAITAFKFNQINDVLRNTSEALTTLTQPSAEFEASMRRANTMAGLGAEEFQDLKQAVQGVASEVPITRDLLGNGLYQVISNGVPKDNWIDFLNTSARSSVGGVADLGEVVTVTSTIIKNYGLEWGNASAIQDKIQMTAKNGVTSFEQLASALPKVSGNASALGVSIDELMATFSTLTGVSGNTSEVSTQMAAVFTALVKPTSQATKQAQQMGIQFDAAAIKAAGGLQPFLQNLDSAITNYSSRTGELKESIYANLFGSSESLRALIPLTGELSDKFTENISAMSNSTGTMDFAFEQNAGTAESWAQIIKNKFSVVGDSVYGFMGKGLPVLQFTVTFGQLLAGFVPLIAMFNSLKTAVMGFSMAQKLSAFWTKIVTAAQWLWNAALNANPVGLVVVGVGLLIGAFVLLWKKFAGFRAFFKTGFDVFKEFGSIIKDFVIDRINGMISGIGLIGSAISKLFKGDFEGAWKDAKEGVKGVVGVDAVENAYNSSKKAVGGIQENYNDHLSVEQEKDKEKAQKKKEEEKHSTGTDTDTTTSLLPQNSILPQTQTTSVPPPVLTNTSNSVGTTKGKNINITIDKLIGEFVINTNNLHNDLSQVKDMVSQVLLDAVNDVNYST